MADTELGVTPGHRLMPRPELTLGVPDPTSSESLSLSLTREAALAEASGSRPSRRSAILEL